MSTSNDNAVGNGDPLRASSAALLDRSGNANGNSPSCPLRLFLIGNATGEEFREACAALDEVACITRFANVEDAVAAFAAGETTAHGVVLVQVHPGQYAPESVERLRRLMPLARWIVLLGSWCEGEGRSGSPLPGTVRIGWREAPLRIRREFPAWFDPGSPWSLPPTATEEERFLAATDAPLTAGKGLVVIWTRRHEMHDLLATLCRRAGYSTTWLHPREPARVEAAAAAVFDGAAFDPAGLAEFQGCVASVAPVPVIALLDAPRVQDVRRAGESCAVVLAKPFRIDEFLDMLGSIRGK